MEESEVSSVFLVRVGGLGEGMVDSAGGSGKREAKQTNTEWHVKTNQNDMKTRVSDSLILLLRSQLTISK